jgi:hypothetical protein
MPYYLVELTLSTNTEVTDRLRPDHRRWVAGLAAEGTVLAGGPWAEGANGAMLYSAPDRDALDRMISQDPYHRESAIVGVKVREWELVVGAWAFPADRPGK